jgi:NAD(P)H dehydrogenase (quinone)
MRQPMLLVTGAGGKTGRAVVRALAARGAPVRALVRRPEPLQAMSADGAVERCFGDMTNAADLARACEGAAALYHICPNMHPAEVQIAAQLIDAARAAGVARFVYHSVLHPQTEEMPHHWNKLRVEEMLLRTTFDVVVLQPAAYYQNVLAYLLAMAREGVYQVPYAATTRLGMVDLEDVAQVAAQVLLEDGHAGATYELASGEILSVDAIAALCGASLGRAVQVASLDRTAWATTMHASGMPAYAVDTLLKMFEYYERYGFSGNATVLRMLLGRAPRTLRDVLARGGDR